MEKKSTRRIAAICLALIIVFTMLAGCNNNGGDPADTGSPTGSPDASASASASASPATSESASPAASGSAADSAAPSDSPRGPDSSGYVRADYHDYSQFPLSDGSTKVSIATFRNDTYGLDAEDMWWWTWIQQVTGIDFEVEQILDSAATERKNLMFASGDLPDALWFMHLEPSDLMIYGQTEGLLLPLNQYINSDVMPNLTELLAFDPAITPLITSKDGNIYSLPMIAPAMVGDSARVFIDKKMLDACGLDVPTTLDGFIDTMYKFKEHDSSLIPLGGCASGTKPPNAIYYIMNALGYVGEEYNDGTKIAVRNGEAVIPAADETFVEVLRVMKQFYDDGIISPDYFTIDNTTLEAQMSDRKLGLYPGVPFTVNPDPAFYEDWVSVKPLTSSWNNKPQWRSSSADKYSVGNWVLSSNTKNAEILCRFVDFLYTPLGVGLSHLGPLTGSEYTLGMTEGWITDPVTGGIIFTDVENGAYAGVADYVLKVAGYQYSVGNYDRWPKMPDYDVNQLRQMIQGTPILSSAWDLSIADHFFRASMEKNITPYEVDYCYPPIVYMAPDDIYAMEDLESVLVPYMQGEIARFITGARDLSEYGAYLNELKNMNIDQYASYFEANYAAYLAN